MGIRAKPRGIKKISTFFEKPIDKSLVLCYNITVPLMNEINNCWCGSMAEHLICNQAVDGSTPFTSSNMGDFPSGQRGQTVNLLSLTSVVRIHHPPPEKSQVVRLGFFQLSVPLTRNVKCPSDEKRTSCVKCPAGREGAEHVTSRISRRRCASLCRKA